MQETDRYLLTIVALYKSVKQVLVGRLHAEQITEVVLLNLFRTGFPASLFHLQDNDEYGRITKDKTTAHCCNELGMWWRFSFLGGGGGGGV